ncbi:MAG: hypothetical protein KY445_16640 [Armatimonadetes bacterium]|nr:hypothetical protein [Armatimonadota bacterium]
MNFPRALGRFFGPWLTFATLSGLFGGFILGAIVTIIGFIAGAVTLMGGVLGGTALQGATEVAKAFPDFAFFVLVAVAWGFVGGFCAGLVAALIGGWAGIVWAFIVALAAISFVYPFYATYTHGRILFLAEIAMAVLMSVCGVFLALDYLGSSAPKLPFATPVGRFLSQSWLVSPSQRARFAGVLLPLLLYGAWEIKIVWPEFVAHRNYAARLGNWTTWQSSKRVVMSYGFPRSSTCQSNLKQIGLGLKQYLADSDGIYPPTPQTAANGVGAIVQPYLKSTQLFQCPQELYRPENPNFASGDYTDYWFNARFYGLNETKLASPFNSILWGDGNTGGREANAAYSLRNLPPNWAPTLRHLRGGANYAFADGHVKWIKSGVISNTAAPRGGTFTLSP